MRQLLILSVCTLCVLLLGGCQGPAEADSADRSLKVTIKGGGQFPDFLVGTWKSEPLEWEISFESNGTVSRVLHQPVRLPIIIAEGKGYREAPDGTIWDYQLGQCQAEYDPDTRRLGVGIFVDHFLIKTPIMEMKGNMVDYFDGPVSEDGEKWNAQWIHSISSGAPDAVPDSGEPQPMVFTKINTP